MLVIKIIIFIFVLAVVFPLTLIVWIPLLSIFFWIVDERLNFTEYVSSDLPLNGANTERPDLLVYDKRVLFRGDNESSNPVTIFEFKKPQRDDFVNPWNPGTLYLFT